MAQLLEPDAQFLRPSWVSGSRTAIQSKFVRADTSADDDGLPAFLNARRRLFGIAYRIVRSAAEAEDIVQDVWIRWQTTDRSTVRDAAAFLATTTTHLAINVIQSARSRRETTVGPSFQESADASADPELELEQREALQSAVLVLLEKLSPTELAAYVLREALDYSYREISSILRVQEANARQLVTRARRHVVDGQHVAVKSTEQRRFLAAFLAAAQKGGLTNLDPFLIGSADGAIGKHERAARNGSTVVEPIAPPHLHQLPDTAVAA